jgi:hypothetical protein
VVVLACALAAGLGLAACTSARNTLGRPVDACYQALPVAAAAVHHQGRFSGVVLLGRHALAASRPIGAVVTAAGGPRPASVCAVAFHGQFRASDVAQPVSGSAPTGHWALVLVALPSQRLIGTAIGPHPPWSLRALF